MSVRPSPIAGRWYPGDPKTLAREVDGFLATATASAPEGRVWGVVAPHAGHRYSGPVAAQAFKCLRGLQPEVVAVVSPLHDYHSAPVLTSGHSAYRTPLGDIEVYTDAVAVLQRELEMRAGMELFPLQDDKEHSLEIELPFLQRVLGEFMLLPVMLRDQSAVTARAVGNALAASLAGRDALLVASSDLSHFYPHARACELDAALLRRVADFDPQGVLDAEAEGVEYACGRGAIAAVLWAAQALGANRAQVLHHATSADVTGDTSSVVGYGAAVIWEALPEGDRPGH